MNNNLKYKNPFVTIELSSELFIDSMSTTPLGSKASDFIGVTFDSLLPDNEKSFFIEKVETLKKDPTPLNFTYNAPSDYSQMHPFQTQMQCNPDTNGFTLFSICTFKSDAAEKNESKLSRENLTLKARIDDLEHEFELQQHNYELFVDNAPIAMYDIDIQGRILTTNKRSLEFFHAAETFELKKHHFLEFIHSDDQERIEGLFNRACQGQEQHFHFRLDHEEHQVFKSCFIPVYDFNSNINKVFSLMEDVTKEHQAEEVLKNQVKFQTQENQRKDKLIFDQSRHVQMGQLIKMIAHQWRQPLSLISTIAGNVEIMLDLESLQKNDIRQAMHNICDEAHALSKIITDFNEFYKPKKTKAKLLLKDIGDSVIEVMKNSLKEDGIDFKRESKAVHEFCTFKNEVTQVILNLLQNSQDVIKERHIEHPIIKLTGYETEEFQVIEVVDNAHGIDETIIDHIFDPYFSTKKSKNGTGLGLHMAKMMVEAHCHGTLSVKNEADGAKFTIELPNNCDLES